MKTIEWVDPADESLSINQKYTQRNKQLEVFHG